MKNMTVRVAAVAALLLTTAACQASVEDKAAPSTGTTISGDNNQSHTSSGEVNNQTGEQPAPTTNTETETDAPTTNVPNNTGGPLVLPDGAAIAEEDWAEAVSDPTATTATVVDGVATLSTYGETVIVPADATEVYITGSELDVVIMNATSITISGSDNDVFVQQVDRVELRGADNDVVWAYGSAPVISDYGADNTVRQARVSSN